MTFPSVVGSPGLTALTSANPGTVVMPASIVAGELLIAVCAGDTSGSMSQSGGSDWTIISGPTNNGTAVCGTIFAKIAAGGDSLSVQFEANDFAAVCFRVQDHGVSNVTTRITVGTPATGADAAPDPPNCNPAVARDYLWIEAFVADDDDDTATYQTSGWSQVGQQQSANSTSSCLVAVASLQSNATAVNPGVMAMALAEEWVAFTLAIWPKISVTITQAVETDSAQALGRGLGIAQVSETDIAQVLTRVKTAPIAQVAETDTSNALSVLRSITITQAVETDIAQEMGTGELVGTIVQVVEDNIAQAITRAKSAAIAFVSEADSAGAFAMLKLREIASVLETNVAQAFGRSKQLAIVSVLEMNIAQLFGVMKAKIIGQAVETDIAQPLVSTSAVAIIKSWRSLWSSFWRSPYKKDEDS